MEREPGEWVRIDIPTALYRELLESDVINNENCIMQKAFTSLPVLPLFVLKDPRYRAEKEQADEAYKRLRKTQEKIINEHEQQSNNSNR